MWLGWFESWEDIMPGEWGIVQIVSVANGDQKSPMLESVLDFFLVCEKNECHKKENKNSSC